MKIATWNVNSVRHRIHLVTRFLRDEQPDVLCLQETKVLNELFPAEPFRKLGYQHQAIHGQKAYHGVAVLAKKPFRETGSQDFCREGHARHIERPCGLARCRDAAHMARLLDGTLASMAAHPDLARGNTRSVLRGDSTSVSAVPRGPPRGSSGQPRGRPGGQWLAP